MESVNISNLDMVDPSIQSLNRLAENISKADTLSAEIANVLQGAAQSGKSLIAKGESSDAAGRISPPKSKVSGHPERRRPRQRQDSVEPPAKRKATRSSSDALPVSPGLFYRYNRDEIYEKVWKMPLPEVAKEYGITDFTLRKTCERLWIPVPGRGYWARKAANQPVVSPPPLPKVQVLRRMKRVIGTKS